jgi:hypothetical protein
MLMEWPEWWHWRIEISSHCLKRMTERSFNETDLRTMVEDATGLTEQGHGTFIVITKHQGCPWEVIVSPDFSKVEIVIVTAYPSP